MTNWTLRSGALIPVLLMLPNLVWMLLPKRETGDQAVVSPVLTVAENLGRVAVLLLPLFYSLDLNKPFSVPTAIGMGLAMTVYYAAWIRYFLGGRTVELFAAPLIGIPLPMAIAPTIFLVLSAYLMSSWLMLGASIWFGISHIWVSVLTLP